VGKALKGTVRIAGIIEESIVDGPGIRMVIFAQGCPHRCKGCHNPETHDFEGGYLMSLEDIVQLPSRNPLLDGVTFSGGEPFSQAKAFSMLGRRFKDLGLDILVSLW
jgi:anaerobic ribonucleoside-triphosphate reductase activating protein